MTARRLASACLVTVALGLGAGCGGDDEDERAATRPDTDTATAPSTDTETAPTATTPEEPPEAQPESPEDQPGGAGDEEPARSQALFTGRGGRIRPRVVRVPPFIAVRVELRSADGRSYRVRFGRRTLRVDREITSVSARFDGMRPGEALSGVATGGRRVRVEATAEPGP